MASTSAPFGGTPGAWPYLNPGSSPARGYRVISGLVWWRLVFWPWRQYLAARTAAITAMPPFLAPYGTSGVYFTDRQSLQGLLSPGEFATRLGLSPQTHVECQRYGCAVIEFDISGSASYGSPYPGVVQGLTVGGAREWMTTGNIALNDEMVVTYIDTARSGPRWFTIPL